VTVSSVEPASPRKVALARRALTLGGSLLALGLLLVGVGPSDVGTAITLFALVALAFGIHTYGRLGPDAG
jgi:dipeptide/tripeptide permease